MEEDNVLLPTLPVPEIGAYRTDKVGTPDIVGAELANYMAFNDSYRVGRPRR